MYLQMLNIDKFVDINSLQQITDPVFMEHGRPTKDGLFSNQIFGITPHDRSSIWAYIELGDIFIHPLALSAIKKYSDKFMHIVYGTKTYRFEKGDFIEDQTGETGIRLLYDNWDKIKWRETKSVFSNERINMLKSDKELIFITSFPVTPPYYRDINDSDVMAVHKVNNIYKRLLSQVKAMHNRKGTFAMFGNISKSNIQKCINELFEYYVIEEFHAGGKNGIFRRNILGVDVVGAARLVISAPKITANRYNEQQVDFLKSGVPLSVCCSIGNPFIIKGLKEFFDNEFIRSGKYAYRKDGKGDVMYLNFTNAETKYSEEYLKKKLSEYIDSPSTRFSTIELPDNEEGVKGHMYISGRLGSSTISSRKATWTDVLFIVASRVLANKYVTITRYPIEDHFCIFHTGISITSTVKTCKATISGVEYPYYPIVEADGDGSNSFVDTLTFSNLYLKGVNGDYDGDQTVIRMAWSDEGNMDIIKFMYSKANLLSVMGDNMRIVERDFQQTLYSLTKEPINEEELDIPMIDPN